jgi:hypothetical protein
MMNDVDAAAVHARVEELAATVARLSAEVQDLSTVVSISQDTASAESGTPTPSPEYETLDEWVQEYFAPMFGRTIGGELRWCAQWTEHAEAISRLEALWRSWEVLRLDPALGMASWFSSYLDQQLPVLLGRSGPFSQCSADRHTPVPPLVLSPHASQGKSILRDENGSHAVWCWADDAGTAPVSATAMHD